MSTKILYAEDEAIRDILTYHKYQVDTVDNGSNALAYAACEHYDLFILDIMLPGLDGLSVLREIRKKGMMTPVLLLTAKGEIQDKIQGLNMGADDYLAKPFAMGELIARIRALLRQRKPTRRILSRWVIFP